MTKLLYQTDAYAREFEAVVQAVDRDLGGVVLDRTAFYPGGGGQPADTGTLSVDAGSGGDLTWVVSGFKRERDRLVHLLEPGNIFPEPGTTVHAEIDWERRYQLMRTHTALHVLCGVVFRDYGALVTGGNMDIDKARMDFELADLSPERVAQIERAANEEIRADRPVSVRLLPRDEAFQIPDLIRTKINLLPEGIQEVRVVEIEGLDLQADGGTHVRSTTDVGGIRVIGTRSKGKSNKRLEIALVDEPSAQEQR